MEMHCHFIIISVATFSYIFKITNDLTCAFQNKQINQNKTNKKKKTPAAENRGLRWGTRSFQ